MRGHSPALRATLDTLTAHCEDVSGPAQAIPSLLTRKLRFQQPAATGGLSPDSEFPWPVGIPEPQADKSDIPDKQDQAAFDLITISTAYALLHELRHVWHHRQPSRPSDRAAEEMDCDVFARSFLMDKIGVYAKLIDKSGDAYAKIVNKRAMGVALGAWIAYEITPAYGRSGTRTHPPVADRIEL
jgi:hypothetical protein